MKAIAGSILVLAAAIILAPALQGGNLNNASIFAVPTGVVGILVLAWALFGKSPKDNQ